MTLKESREKAAKYRNRIDRAYLIVECQAIIILDDRIIELEDCLSISLKSMEQIRDACKNEDFVKVQGDFIGHIIFGEAAQKVDESIEKARQILET